MTIKQKIPEKKKRFVYNFELNEYFVSEIECEGYSVVSCHTSSRHGNEAEKSSTMIDFSLTVQVLLLCCCSRFLFVFVQLTRTVCVSLLPSTIFDHNFFSHFLKIALTIDFK